MKRRNFSNFSPIQAPNLAIRRYFGTRRVINHHFSAFGTDFSLCGRPSPTQNSRHACQVVSRKGKSRLGPHLGQSSESGFSQPTTPTVAHCLYKPRHIVFLVRTQGSPVFSDRANHHGFCRFPLGSAKGMRGFNIHRQSIPVFQ